MEHLSAVLSREESDTLAARIDAHFDQHGFGLWAMEIPNVASFVGFVGLSVPSFEAHFTPCARNKSVSSADHIVVRMRRRVPSRCPRATQFLRGARQWLTQ
jgi:hypothetical protein